MVQQTARTGPTAQTGQAVGSRLAGRIALVTGASRGVGQAVARRFAAEGAHVVAVARTVGGLEELDDAIRQQAAQSGTRDGAGATLVPMDLRQPDALDALGQALYERFGRLDIVVGNAAVIGVSGPLTHMDVKVFAEVMAVNVTANWRLLRSVDPLLRQSTAGRAIFVTDRISHDAAPYLGPYAASKQALEAMVRAYAMETRLTPVKANLIALGPVATTLRASFMPGEDQSRLATPDTVSEIFVRMADTAWTGSGEIVDGT
ncbi:MAG: SDR family oxidoreductase [Alphaproteobacteria bacterium]